MKLKIYAIITGVLLVVASCSKNEFFLEFNLVEDVTDNYNVTYFATEKPGMGMTVQAVASVMKGKCSLRGVTKAPTLVYISDRKNGMPLILYVKKGDKIEISGSSAAPISWNVSSEGVNTELDEWRRENQKILLTANNDSINAEIADYVEQNPDKEAGLILLLCYYDRGSNYRQYVDLMQQYSHLPSKMEWIMLAAFADQYTDRLAYPARLETMIAKSTRKNSQDTLDFTKRNPGFLMFWQSDSPHRKEFKDSLKKLLKEFPDTGSRVIADINLDNDSTLWRNTIRRDTIEGGKRLWVPAGFADRNIMKLRVTTLPYFIVINREGEQVYRGADLSMAITEFRNRMNETDSVASTK